MKKLEMMYEGKAKKIYATDKADEVIVYYKDDATAFNGEKKGQIEDKGVMNNAITATLFEILAHSDPRPCKGAIVIVQFNADVMAVKAFCCKPRRATAEKRVKHNAALGTARQNARFG